MNRRRAKEARVQLRGSLIIQESHELQGEKVKGTRLVTNKVEIGGSSKQRPASGRRCSICDKINYNGLIYKRDIKSNNKSDIKEF